MSEKVDVVGGKGLKVVQDTHGVKASVDSLLLARFVRPEPGWSVVDLGCGNGVVGLVMAHDQPECQVLGVEIQGPLLSQASEGARLNRLWNMRFLRADLRQFPWDDSTERFDLVVANPPYRKVGSGRLSPDPVRAAARHELVGNVNDFARAAGSLLREGCASAWIFLPERIEDLLAAVEDAGMEPVRYRFVHSRVDEPPSLVLLEAIKGGGLGMRWEEEPLVLYRGTGRDYTVEAREILYGN